MTKIGIDKFKEGLCSIKPEEFTLENIYQYLADTPVDFDSLNPYLFFSEKFYTRNLIHRNEIFELMAICWDKGQVSRVHNHAGQNCWMAVPKGTLRVQNFRALELDEAQNHCLLAESEKFDISEKEPCRVEQDEPIHQVLNLSEFNNKAVSLHVYSRPIERCLSYCRETHKYHEVKLFYTSINGKLCDGITL